MYCVPYRIGIVGERLDEPVVDMAITVCNLVVYSVISCVSTAPPPNPLPPSQPSPLSSPLSSVHELITAFNRFPQSPNFYIKLPLAILSRLRVLIIF